jgi:RNA polymerase sigma-70 factor (ECF subfamily)
VTDVTELRPLVFSVAYGMLGSVASAEDITQEALLRMHRESESIRSPSAYAVTITTRLAIDELRSARARREVYVGAWLPEPLVATDPSAQPETQAEVADQLSMAFLVLLERLSPVERAVLLLRDVFEYDYERIAEIVGRSEVNCRQILVRARQHVADQRPRFNVRAEQKSALSERFFQAAQAGDLESLEAMLAEDIAFTGDGGGKAPALATPAVGRRRVARFIIGLFRQAETMGLRLEPVLVNGQPGGIARAADGSTVGVFAFDIDEGTIVAVHNVINPDKLAHLNR